MPHDLSELADIDLPPDTRIAYGNGSLARAGGIVQRLGAQRVLVVSDAGLRRAGHLTRLESVLASSGIESFVYAGVHADPTEKDVEACHAAGRDFEPEALVALGGGSSIDTAKGFLFLASGGGRMRDYWGHGKARGPMLPLVAIPTTAGTGSEVQSFALVTHEESHAKMACGDARARPRVALLDPELTLTMPPSVTACTGLDTLVHAVETAVTGARNALSLGFSREAFRLVHGNLERVLADPRDVTARGAMLRAATLAGLAIEHSMLGAAHAMANPLTARHPIPHGQAVGMLLPHVLAFNAAQEPVRSLYAVLSRAAGLVAPLEEDARAVEALAERIGRLLRAARMPADLSALGVEEAEIPELAHQAAAQWTARFNPRPVDAAAFKDLYARALGK